MARVDQGCLLKKQEAFPSSRQSCGTVTGESAAVLRLALQMEEGATSQELRAARKLEEAENGSSLGPPELCSPATPQASQ